MGFILILAFSFQIDNLYHLRFNFICFQFMFSFFCLIIKFIDCFLIFDSIHERKSNTFSSSYLLCFFLSL